MGQEQAEVGVDTECIMGGDAIMPSRIECMHFIEEDDELNEITNSFKRHLSAPAASLHRQLSCNDKNSIAVTQDDEDDFSGSEPDVEPGLWRQETEQHWPTYNDRSAGNQAVQAADGFWSCRPPSSSIALNQVDLVGKAANETNIASAPDQWQASSSAPFPDATTTLPGNPMPGGTPTAPGQWLGQQGQQGYYMLVPIPGYQGTQAQDMSINPKRNRARKRNV